MRYLGIDLGTTNCGFASAASEGPVQVLAIPQLVSPGEIRAEPLLPSALYLAREDEFAEGLLDLPWRAGGLRVAGSLAVRRGAESLGRLVTSAKSWLSHAGASRTEAILPAQAPEGVPRISPIEASTHYLEHLREAWDHLHPGEPFASQTIVLTVPASFDAAARELTERAAQQADFGETVLLEEPQAAFYAWLDHHDDWRDHIGEGDLVLVIDIGGGTTDLTLITVTGRNGALELERVAVGEHLLLGGDNMDLALAHSIAQKLALQGHKLDALRMQSLWQQCRIAKERLLSNPEAQAEPVTILGRGSSLIGGSLKTMLERDEVERLLVDGFFPQVRSDDMPARRIRSGLTEVGLPYESDAAITRHLARFLRRGEGELARPTHVLFNGGVFHAAHLRERVMDVLNSWLAADGAPPAQSLAGEDLMHAVARGAAAYARVRQRGGIRIRGGVPRTYYVGIESAMPAVPGMPAPLKALAVAPFGMEEGTSAEVPAGEFGLVVGEPAQFRFFASLVRKQDELGDLLDEFGDELEELTPISVCLPAEGDAGDVVRVRLETRVTETGILELWCAARDGSRWKLEFQVREKLAQ